MKQVARKSTTSVPRKFAAESHQWNGSVQVCESSVENIPGSVSASVTSNALLTSSSNVTSVTGPSKKLNTKNNDPNDLLRGVHLTNGIRDSCKQMLGNETGCSDVVKNNHNAATASTDSVRQQTAGHSACSVTCASNLPVSAANVQPPRRSQSSSNLKHVNAENVKPLSHVASEVTVSNLSNDVIIVVSKPDVDSTKRSASPDDEKKCEVKRARLDSVLSRTVRIISIHAS